MKTTIDIPEKEMRDVIRFTGAQTKREAVVAAIAEYNRRRRVKKVLGFLGKMDGIMSQEELRRMREDR